jgi:AraC-like DNA-binding protein
MCVQLEKDVLFYDEHGGEDSFRYMHLESAAEKIGDALDRESSTEIKLACDRYVQFVLRFANQRIEVARGQFLATLFQLFRRVQRRHPMRPQAREDLLRDLSCRLEDARSMNRVIASFNDVVQRLSLLSSKAWQGPSVMMLETTLQFLQENFFEDLPLPTVARKAGFSVPVFTRVFKQATGSSYLAYLRVIRVENAKKLLLSTTLTLEQIAQASGFNSQHHLIRGFKKVTGQTPGSFRSQRRHER